jgi:hypothetical protein
MANWLRDYTPRNALILDNHDGVVFVVTVPRRYWGARRTRRWGYRSLK